MDKQSQITRDVLPFFVDLRDLTEEKVDDPANALDDVAEKMFKEHGPRVGPQFYHILLSPVLSGVRDVDHISRACGWESPVVDVGLELTELNDLMADRGLPFKKGDVFGPAYVSAFLEKWDAFLGDPNDIVAMAVADAAVITGRRVGDDIRNFRFYLSPAQIETAVVIIEQPQAVAQPPVVEAVEPASAEPAASESAQRQLSDVEYLERELPAYHVAPDAVPELKQLLLRKRDAQENQQKATTQPEREQLARLVHKLETDIKKHVKAHPGKPTPPTPFGRPSAQAEVPTNGDHTPGNGSCKDAGVVAGSQASVDTMPTLSASWPWPPIRTKADARRFLADFPKRVVHQADIARFMGKPRSDKEWVMMAVFIINIEQIFLMTGNIKQARCHELFERWTAKTTNRQWPLVRFRSNTTEQLLRGLARETVCTPSGTELDGSPRFEVKRRPEVSIFSLLSGSLGKAAALVL